MISAAEKSSIFSFPALKVDIIQQRKDTCYNGHSAQDNDHDPEDRMFKDQVQNARDGKRNPRCKRDDKGRYLELFLTAFIHIAFIIIVSSCFAKKQELINADQQE